MQIYSYAHILFCEPWQIIVAKCKDPPPPKKKISKFAKPLWAVRRYLCF